MENKAGVTSMGTLLLYLHPRVMSVILLVVPLLWTDIGNPEENTTEKKTEILELMLVNIKKAGQNYQDLPL